MQTYIVKRGFWDWMCLAVCGLIVSGYVYYFFLGSSSIILKISIAAHVIIGLIVLICSLLSTKRKNFPFFLVIAIMAILSPIVFPIASFALSTSAKHNSSILNSKLKPRRKSQSKYKDILGKNGTFKVGDIVVSGVIKRASQKTVTLELPNGDSLRVPQESVILEEKSKQFKTKKPNIERRRPLRIVPNQEMVP